MSDNPSINNPYAAPKTSPEIPSEPDPLFQIVLASRWLRLGATLIDGVILIALIFAIAIPLAFFGFDMESSSSTDLFEPFSGLGNNFISELIDIALGVIIYLAVNGYFMVKSGQTIGKKALGIQVVSRQTHQLLVPGMIIGMRFVLTTLLSYVPIFPLIDALFIFSAEKRCVHDHMAGSIVINRNPAL